MLVQGGVSAYVCSHILAFDVQVHRGVLQLCTAGAGTAHRMPDGVEYLHCVQAALDAGGLRCQVLDTAGEVREAFAWPPDETRAGPWQDLAMGGQAAPLRGALPRGGHVELRCAGRTPDAPHAREQTILAAHRPGALPPLWIGLRGARQVLTAIVARAPGRSPSYWLGPALGAGQAFDLHVALHPGMGPGGIMYRPAGDRRWTSFTGASATGVSGRASMTRTRQLTSVMTPMISVTIRASTIRKTA